MAFHLLLLAVAFSMVPCLFAEESTYMEAGCNDELLECLMKIGDKYGNNDNAFQTANVTYIGYRTTNVRPYYNVSCLKYHTEGGGNVTVMNNDALKLFHRDGVNSTVNVEEYYNELFFEPDDGYCHYKCIANLTAGLYMGYRCSKNGTKISHRNPPNIGLLATNTVCEDIKAEIRNHMQSCGYGLCKEFDCSCQ